MLEKIKKLTFWIAIIEAIKLAAEALGFKLIEDAQVNAIADGLATLDSSRSCYFS